ncbi:MAG TPA: thermonuclease family protein [Baekduia sp.]|uniref:thermonuclease family protein n=1 Tax=Baekduia sp. TaxID=2600305 RepID=UPI002D79C568|nr:thermonuclease family protein [Baekduia sp.]HET6510517.1 thermonuclease family protein [Baekduia sp.]
MLRRLTPWIVLVVLAAAVGWSRVGGDGSGGSGGEVSARVVRVVDGDTIVVSIDGREDRVRYIGIDTPESVKPGTPVQCYAKRASKENARLVAGRTVRLVSDAEARDRYGRRLAYVYRSDDGLLVNLELARTGYARPLTIAPNVAHAGQIAAAVASARRAGRGLWSACSR